MSIAIATPSTRNCEPPGLGKPPVLIVGNFLSAVGRAHGVCEELASRLSAREWQVLTSSHHANRLARLADMVSTVWRRRRDFDVAQVDVYSGHGFLWAEAVCMALRATRKPYILTLHGGNLPNFARRWPGRVRRLLDAACVVTAPSPYLVESMKPYRQDLSLLANPLDLSRYDFQPRSILQPRVVWLRSFHRIYNPTLAPRVLAQLTSRFPDIQLLMIGPDRSDGSREATEKLAVDLGVAERIEFVGPVPKAEIASWLQRGDIFLNTTNVDNTPVSVQEAMACGIPVVSTRVGGIPFLLNHERDALLVEPDDAQAMAAAVERLFMDSSLAQRLSQSGRQRVEEADLSVILPQWEELFTRLASEKREAC